MQLTNILLKPKSKQVMVVLKSLVSGHKRIFIKDRGDDKVDKIFFDPFIQEESVYRELKRIRSM